MTANEKQFDKLQGEKAAKLAMIFGILSFGSAMTFILAPLGVIFGTLGLKKARIATTCEVENGQRTAGVVLSKIGAIFSSIAVFLVLFTIVTSLLAA